MQHKCNGLEHETGRTGSVISVIIALAYFVTLEGTMVLARVVNEEVSRGLRWERTVVSETCFFRVHWAAAVNHDWEEPPGKHEFDLLSPPKV